MVTMRCDDATFELTEATARSNGGALMWNKSRKRVLWCWRRMRDLVVYLIDGCCGDSL